MSDMIVIKDRIGQVAVIVGSQELCSKFETIPTIDIVLLDRYLGPFDVRFSRHANCFLNGTTGMFKRVAPAADARVEFEIGQCGNHFIIFYDGRWAGTAEFC